MMNIKVQSELPTIYTDMNVFRYLAAGKLEIDNPELYCWVFSEHHLEEILRSNSLETLDGMAMLQAVEITEYAEGMTLVQHADIKKRFQEYKKLYGITGRLIDFMLTLVLRLFGSSNFDEVKDLPNSLVATVDEMESALDNYQMASLHSQVKETAEKITSVTEQDLQSNKHIDELRKEAGITSHIREEALQAESPLEYLWENVFEGNLDMEMKEFFGLEGSKQIPANLQNQHGRLSYSYMMLNMLGISADKGLANRKKFKKSMSDGNHSAMSSYCDALLSSDTKFCIKSSILMREYKCSTNVLWFKYLEEGMRITLKSESAS